MAQIRHQEIKLYIEAKNALISLICQIVTVFACFSILLLVTRGRPSALSVVIIFVLSTLFVAFIEQRRLIFMRFRKSAALAAQKNIELSINISSDLRLSELNIPELFHQNNSDRGTKKNVDGWQLVEVDFRKQLQRKTSIREWFVDQIILQPFTQRKTSSLELLLQKKIDIHETEYLFWLSPISQHYWMFVIESLLPSVSLPKDLKLILENPEDKKRKQRVYSSSSSQDRLSIRVYISSGDMVRCSIVSIYGAHFSEIFRF